MRYSVYLWTYLSDRKHLKYQSEVNNKNESPKVRVEWNSQSKATSLLELKKKNIFAKV